jgi:Asp-tRNA(Asn)/Glu-tRNA(Gln) amidotransferase A subunit family amidase
MLWELSASEAAKKILNGQITSVELTDACLERIRETDAGIGAWAFLDPDLVRKQALAMDDLRRRGRPVGPLHGVPVGVKDVFDTADMPTAWGVGQFESRRPKSDATIISKLREAGAIILGKTVTTELAFAGLGDTRNPHNGKHTSGGSSAGSAAGVAAGHVPVSIGSQTNGSVIRPASFCGVYGFKPSRGVISRQGCLQTSPTLDQVGVMGRSLEDVALLCDVLTGYDPADPLSHMRPKPQMLSGCRAEPPVKPCFAWFELPFYDQLSDAMRQGLDELLDTLGESVDRLPAPRSFDEVVKNHQIIHEYEFCKNLETNPNMKPDQIHDTLIPVLERARRITREDYNLALEMVEAAEKFFAAFFHDYDAIIAPSALAEAPLLDDGIGDPICSTIWTFSGLPCISLPWLDGESGLPAGVQLIGSAEEDDRLLRTAAWLEGILSKSTENSAEDGAEDGAEIGAAEGRII